MFKKARNALARVKWAHEPVDLWDSPFALADFEVFSTIETRKF